MGPAASTAQYHEVNENALKEYAPAVLAYIGDAVLELLVRAHMVKNSRYKINTLHNMTVDHVKAENQARIVHALHIYLNEDEREIIRRGRNAKGNVPKNVSPGDYHLSTGFEALLGHLYLKGDVERLYELVDKAIQVKRD